ncbi:MAG: pirin family protein [Hyphomicrobiales bacterium]|nr:pirin family protein [Hyphomicrobiales bacterium]
MLQIRKADERGRADFGWLDSRHTFSFGEYHDPAFMGFGPLRVINDDRVAAGGGFGAHPHRDMEIVSYVIEGGLAHKDSIGTGSTIAPGDVQRMSAGTGIRHSEFNASQTDPVHFLQIWLLPEKQGLPPSYEQKTYSPQERKGALRLVASRDARDGSVKVHADADLYATLLGQGEKAEHAFAPGRIGWVQVARGALVVNGVRLNEGDGLAVADEERIALEGAGPEAEALVFDMGR